MSDRIVGILRITSFLRSASPFYKSRDRFTSDFQEVDVINYANTKFLFCYGR